MLLQAGKKEFRAIDATDLGLERFIHPLHAHCLDLIIEQALDGILDGFLNLAGTENTQPGHRPEHQQSPSESP